MNEGPAICDNNGFLLSNVAMNDLFWTILEGLYEEDNEYFPKTESSIEEIRNLTNIYKTMWHTYYSQMFIAKVAEPDFMIVKRWYGEHYTKGKAPSEEMHVHYTQQELLNKCFERYTSAI